MQKKYYIIIKSLCCIALICSTALCGCGRKQVALFGVEQAGDLTEQADDTAYIVQTSEEMIQQSAEDSFEDAEDDTQKLEAVYVCGAVVHPGVYYLEQGSIVQDALNAAGGFDGDAAEAYVNLAAAITDGEKIYVPYTDEVVGISGAEPAGTVDVADVGNKEGNAKVNINTATRDELMTLPGIGGSKADAIIQYRESSGPFRCIEDIMKVNGIKEGTYENIKECVCVD